MAKYTTGIKANMFYDPNTGVKIIQGNAVELTPDQLGTKRIRSAINSGHLVLYTGSSERQNITNTPPVELDEEQLKQLKDLFWVQVTEHAKDAKKVKDRFSLDQLKQLAVMYELEPEAGDTKLDLVEAIIAEAEVAE